MHRLLNLTRWPASGGMIGAARESSATFAILVVLEWLAPSLSSAEVERAPIPDRLVVLTFDDSVKSHFTVAAPILKKYGFSATFFITEGFTFKTNKRDYMTWEEIQSLDRQGFEIGNHTRDHLGIKADNVDQLEDQLRGIDEGCAAQASRNRFRLPGQAMPLPSRRCQRCASMGSNLPAAAGRRSSPTTRVEGLPMSRAWTIRY